jgi:release factor glutamine methyltransferase
MIHLLTQEQIISIEKQQSILQENWKNRNSEGEFVEYLGKKFIVLPNVFPPSNDSQILVENLPSLNNSTVLDVATGCGVIAIFSALKGAGHVTGVDINQDAVKCAKMNINTHCLTDRVNILCSDLFNQLKPKRYDIITVNLPFRNKYAPDMVASAQWDTNFQLHKRFFSQVVNYMQPHGKLYMPQPNYPELYDTLDLAHRTGFKNKRNREKTLKWH